MGVNPKRSRQSKRKTGPGLVAKGSPEATVRNRNKDRKKTGERKARKQKDVASHSGRRAVDKSPRRGKPTRTTARLAEPEILKADSPSQTERVAARRGKRYSVGISKGGQTGRRERGRHTPSRGRRGATPANQ
jgi:hypothetical protein